MSTQGKLWLGFGTLLTMLVVTAFGVSIWLRSVSDEVRRVTDKGEPERRAAYEMKVHSAATGLGVLNYLHTRAPGYRERVQEDAAEFRKFNAQYERLVREQGEVARQVAAVYEEYYMLGVRLMEGHDERDDACSALSARLGADQTALAAVVDGDPKRPRTPAKVEALLGMERSLAAAGLWFGDYRQTLAEEDKQRLVDAERDFHVWFARYLDLPLTSEENEWAVAFAKRAEGTLDQLNQLAAALAAEQEELQRFFYLRIRLDTLFDEGILKSAQEELIAAGNSARETLRGVLLGAAVLVAAGVLVSLLTAFLVSGAIVRTEETLRVTLASIGDAVIATDRLGRITFLNRVAESLTGWSQAEAVSHPLTQVFHVVQQDTREPIADVAREVIKRGAVLGLADQSVLVSTDGTEVPIDDSAAPILNEQGRVVGVVLVFRDASLRRRDEQALRDADRRKNEFLAMLAHELRNPLAPLRNGLYILRAPAVDAATSARVLEMMVRQVQNMTRMIDDLLDVSRITRGKIELRREPVDVSALVERASEMLRPEFEAADRHLAVSVPPRPLWVDGDATRLEQVVGNLLSNALKYSRPGGHTWVEVDDDDDIVVRVRDDGIGIAPEMLPQVFDLFAQADSTFARSQGGLGIGLTLVRNLVERHGGRVCATSPGVDRGSEFEVRLPRSQREGTTAPPAAPGPAAAPAAAASAGVRVLVVDDNVDSAESLSLLLELRGHQVRTAHDGATALELAHSLHPQLIFLDIGLPGIDGYEVATRLRADPALRDAVIVAMTGYGRPEDIERSRQSGFHHHLVKPVDMENLRVLLGGGSTSISLKNPPV